MPSFPFYVAARYLFSRGRVRIVHLVSVITSLSLCIIMAAGVIILSVFNGYKEMLLGADKPLDVELLVRQNNLQPFDAASVEQALAPLQKEHALLLSCMLHTEALVSNGFDFVPCKLLGVDAHYSKVAQAHKALFKGQFSIQSSGMVLGSSLFLALGVPPLQDTITLYLPRHGQRLNPVNPAASLAAIPGVVKGVVNTQAESYNATLFMNIDELRLMAGYSSHACDAIGIAASKPISKSVCAAIEKALPKQYELVPRRLQQPETTKLVAVEKWFSYCILSFVMLLIAFNVVCSSALLIIEKKSDQRRFEAWGASLSSVRRLFRLHSLGVTLIGVVSGLILGYLLVILQHYTGFATYWVGSFAQPYPVHIQWGDFLALALVALFLCYVAALLPSLFLIKKGNPQ